MKVLRNKNLWKKLVALQILQNYFSEFALMHFGLIVFLLVMLLVQKTIQLSDFVPIYNGAFVIPFVFSSCFAHKKYAPPKVSNFWGHIKNAGMAFAFSLYIAKAARNVVFKKIRSGGSRYIDIVALTLQYTELKIKQFCRDV